MNLRLDNSSDVIHEHTYEVDVTFLYVFAGLNLAIDRVRRHYFLTDFWQIWRSEVYCERARKIGLNI